MLKELKEGKLIPQILIGFILLHTVIFLLSFRVFRSTPTVDVVEAFYWGKEWQLGYHKHPPLSAWIMEIFAMVFGASMGTSYILMEVIIAVSMLGIFLTARKFLPPYKALFCALLLEGIAAASIAGRTFNADTVQIPFWIFGFYFYIRAIEKNKPLDWAIFGLNMGLAFLGKYFSLIIAFSIFCSFISLKQTRDLLKTPGPWLAVLVFIAVISPHIYWALTHDFATVSYGFRAIAFSLTRFLKFTSLALGSLAPCIILFAILNNFSFRPKLRLNLKEPAANALLAVSTVPFLITMVIAFLPHMLGLIGLSPCSFSCPFA